MISCIAIWLVEMNIALFGTVISGRRFEEVLPVGMIALVLWTYAFGLCGALGAGLVTALAGGVLLGALALILILTRRRAFPKGRFFTPAFFAYLALLALAAYVSFGRVAANWDECSHWATVVKAMTYEGAFSTNPDCHILFRSYPPGAAVYQYFYQAANRLFTGAPFTEWLLFFAYDAFCLALLMPLLRLIDKKRWLYTPLFCAVLAALPLCWFDAMYASLYIDGLLALLALYALSCFRFGTRGGAFDALACCTALAMLVLVKDAGLFFAILIPLFALISAWIAEGKAFWRPGRLWPYAAGWAAAGLAKWSWSREVAQSGVRVMFNESIDPVQLWRILTGAETGYQRTILENYVQKFFSPALSLGPLDISFCMIFLALTALTVLLFLLARKRGGGKKRAYAAMLNPLWLTVVYILGLGVLYLFKFGRYEGIHLASYARYIKIGFIVWSLALAAEWMLYLTRYAKKPLWPAICTAAAVLAGALFVSGLGPMLTRKSVAESVETQAPAAAAAALVEAQAEPDARIYVLTQALDGYEYYQLRYLLYPRRVNGDAFSIGQAFYEGDIWTRAMDAEEWREILTDGGYGYVLVYRANDYLNEAFAPLFAAGAEDGTLYRYDTDAGTLSRCAP